ncbi:MAG: VOC family protein [Actinomycetota bacterium]
MLSEIHVAIDCVDVDAQADFWVAALGYRRYGAAGQYRSLVPDGDTPLPKLVLQQVDDPPKAGKNKLHLDLIVGDGIEAEAERIVALGATQLSDTIDEAGTRWIVMADPEGNEFCLCVR